MRRLGSVVRERTVCRGSGSERKERKAPIRVHDRVVLLTVPDARTVQGRPIPPAARSEMACIASWCAACTETDARELPAGLNTRFVATRAVTVAST